MTDCYYKSQRGHSHVPLSLPPFLFIMLLISTTYPPPPLALLGLIGITVLLIRSHIHHIVTSLSQISLQVNYKIDENDIKGGGGGSTEEHGKLAANPTSK